MRNLLIIIGVILLFSSCNREKAIAQDSIIDSIIEVDNDFSIIFAGDLMMHKEQIASGLQDDGSYNFDTSYHYIKDILARADFAIVNLEVPLGISPYRGYPRFSSPKEVAEAAFNAGFDFFLTANNHSCDRNKEGVEKNIDVLNDYNYPFTGTFKNKAERDSLYPYYIYQNGLKIAILNYTYATNGLDVEFPNIVNLIDEDLIIADLQQAVEDSADIKIVCIHWGTEYKLLPHIHQKNMYKVLEENGADIVIGSHPHVIQPMEFYTSDTSDYQNLIVYSLGNLVSHQRTHPRDGGAMLQINFEVDGDKWRIKNAGYYITWVYDHWNNDKEYFTILPASEYKHKPEYFIEQKHYDKMITFIEAMDTHLDANNINIGEYVYNVETKEWELETINK